MTKLIALDVDGILLSYTEAYPRVWQHAFGVKLEMKNPGMYHAFNQYECPFESEEQKKHFYDSYTEEFWEDFPIIDGALEACNELVEMGYELVCVTAMPDDFLVARKKNLLKHGFPISETYAVGRDRSLPTYNPKLEILRQLKPVAFVDDYIVNFMELHDMGIHKALVDRNQPDSPNRSQIHLASTVHADLNEFVDFWQEYAG